MLMFLSLCIPVTAINAETVLNPDLSTENTEMYVIHENETNQHIDDLFALRCKLALDFNKNEDAILQIDNQLAELGVEYITQSEFLNTLGYDVLPAAEVGEGDGNTQWTSRRLVSTYRGQQIKVRNGCIQAIMLHIKFPTFGKSTLPWASMALLANMLIWPTQTLYLPYTLMTTRLHCKTTIIIKQTWISQMTMVFGLLIYLFLVTSSVMKSRTLPGASGFPIINYA